MARRDAMLGMLASEQQQAMKPKKKEGMTLEEILRLAGGAAPIVGGVAGTLIGGPAGTAIGGGIGGLAGVGANMAADHMQQEREGEEIEDEEEAMRELARKQRLAAFI